MTYQPGPLDLTSNNLSADKTAELVRLFLYILYPTK
jgi:hypothetical protein